MDKKIFTNLHSKNFVDLDLCHCRLIITFVVCQLSCIMAAFSKLKISRLSLQPLSVDEQDNLDLILSQMHMGESLIFPKS